jgi:hypothetical protein
MPPIMAGALIIATLAGLVLLVIFGTKEKPQAPSNAATPESKTWTDVQPPAPLLAPVDTADFRKSFRLVLVIVGTIAALHVGAAASVLPYVWVSDEPANCGARLV